MWHTWIILKPPPAPTERCSSMELVPGVKSLGTAALGHWLSPTGCEGAGTAFMGLVSRVITGRVRYCLPSNHSAPHTSPTVILSSGVSVSVLRRSIQSSGPGLGALIQRVRCKASEHEPLQASETRPSRKQEVRPYHLDSDLPFPGIINELWVGVKIPSLPFVLILILEGHWGLRFTFYNSSLLSVGIVITPGRGAEHLPTCLRVPRSEPW